MWFSEFQLSDLIGGFPEFEVQQIEVRDGVPREITLQPETCAALHSAIFYHLFPLLANRKKLGLLFLFSLWWVFAVFSPRAVVSLCSLGQSVVQSGFRFVLNSCLAFCVELIDVRYPTWLLAVLSFLVLLADTNIIMYIISTVSAKMLIYCHFYTLWITVGFMKFYLWTYFLLSGTLGNLHIVTCLFPLRLSKETGKW